MNYNHVSSRLLSMEEYTGIKRIEDVDQEIQRIIEHHRALNAHRNSLVPISTLPPEVLCSIFRLCAPTPGNGTPNLAFCQVCRQWRTLALDDPQLWRTPILSRPQLGLEMVARAKGLPLTIELDIQDIACPPVLKSALLKPLRTTFEANAVVHCHLIRLPSDLSSLLDPLIDLLALRSGETLRTLDLRFRDCPNAMLGGRAATPEVIFSDLRELRLTRCLWPLSAACYFNLSVLEIREPPSTIDLDTALNIVRESPNLTTLAFIDALFELLPILQSPHKLTLSLLKQLTLQTNDEPSTLLLFLSALDLPSLSDLRVKIDRLRYQQPVEAADFIAILRCITNKITGPLINALDTLSYCITTQSLDIGATCPINHPGSSERLSFLVSVYPYRKLHAVPTIEHHHEVLSQLPTIMSLEKLERFTMKLTSGHMAGDLPTLCDLLLVMPAVKEIHTVGDGLLILSETLTADHITKLHSLERLRIMDADLGSRWFVNGETILSGMRRLSQNILGIVAGSGRHIEVVLDNCVVSREQSTLCSGMGMRVTRRRVSGWLIPGPGLSAPTVLALVEVPVGRALRQGLLNSKILSSLARVGGGGGGLTVTCPHGPSDE
ncbi:hypothetical protein BC629DRAFT_1720536 [Irpex lacteus]|nr:hypothetical protein BC629DRAFT_1720536 [Irpex lacteus]